MSRSGGIFKLNLSTLSYLIVGVVCFLNGIMLGAYFMHKHDLSSSSSAVDTFEKYPSSVRQNVIKSIQPTIENPVGKPAVKIKDPSTISTSQTKLAHSSSNLLKAPNTIKYVYQTPNLDSKRDSKSVLIVGGTDGSGTRRVVQVLTDLGVTMVSEDPETYDIHADLVSGWPPVVKPVLKHTHTLNYKPEDLPKHVNQQTIAAVRKITEQAQKDSTKPQSSRLAVGGALNIKTHAHASAIQYGFKAPVAMTLLPYWTSVLPRVKFLHVLRDGRDIAFSANQGPVEKFYEDMYAKHAADVKDKRVQAIQLWSDWNVGILQWSLAYVQSLSNTNTSSSDKGYGYMMLHSEDIVSPDMQVRYEAMAKLAMYVGSDMSADRICCMAVKDSTFMGSHDRSQHAVVSKRYGKWEGYTRNNKGLLDQLYGKGKEGLKLFGYDPLRTSSTLVEDGGGLLGYRCVKQTDDCLDPEEKRQQEELVATVKQKNCMVQMGVDFPGADISSVSMPETMLMVESAVFCCEQCKVNPACKFFTTAHSQHVCYLKSSQTDVVSKEQLISGAVVVQ
ncbi:hypothetical protein EON65_45025 [archaeon]|nr:MAG: hypothetical protein EON65_45025 [archaeon]